MLLKYVSIVSASMIRGLSASHVTRRRNDDLSSLVELEVTKSSFPALYRRLERCHVLHMLIRSLYNGL